jgi:hypothetical protein
MAVSLRTYLNTKLKEKGISSAQAKKNASKYKSIAAAKKAGALYYTDKNGKVMAAVYAEDLKKPMTSSPRPKARPKTEPKVAKTAAQPKVTTRGLGDTRSGRGDGTVETVKRRLDQKSPQNKARDAEISKRKLGTSVRRTLLNVKNPFLKSDKAKASKWKTWFSKNKNSYVKSNGDFDMSKAMKDFRKIK